MAASLLLILPCAAAAAELLCLCRTVIFSRYIADATRERERESCSSRAEPSFSGFALSANVGKSIIESSAVLLSACVHHCVMVLLFEMRHALLYIHTPRHLGEGGGGCYIPPAGGICIYSSDLSEESKEHREKREKDELGTSLRDVIGF